ncbi:MAG TPA: TetR/AcrR family transcriptional regulator [Blastococcus sp.]|nr:TetR/AcrR family transcriptional regulator [Blastococcus sp.]
MSELIDRRARKKAQTREQIRSTARRLFAEQGFDVVTTADIAREADVAVQTIFNHFATKEELFFDGRTPWVDGAAAAVRDRGPGVGPLRALRGYLVQLVETLVGSMSCTERRAYVSTLEASDTLRTQERELIFGCERRLADALFEAWTSGEAIGAEPVPADPGIAAPLTAATWMATTRVLIVNHRPRATVDPAAFGAEVAALGERLLVQLETCVAELVARRAAATARPSEPCGREAG